MAVEADFKTFWGHAKRILDLSSAEKEHVLVWLAGYAPDAVKAAFDALDRDNTPMPSAPVNVPSNPNPTPPNAGVPMAGPPK